MGEKEEFERLVAVLKMPETEEERVSHGVRKQVLWDMLFGEKGIEELGETDMNGHNPTDEGLNAKVNKQSPSPSASN